MEYSVFVFPCKLHNHIVNTIEIACSIWFYLDDNLQIMSHEIYVSLFGRPVHIYACIHVYAHTYTLEESEALRGITSHNYLRYSSIPFMVMLNWLEAILNLFLILGESI